jgi:hypothetical protein
VLRDLEEVGRAQVLVALVVACVQRRGLDGAVGAAFVQVERALELLEGAAYAMPRCRWLTANSMREWAGSTCQVPVGSWVRAAIDMSSSELLAFGRM